MDMETVLSKAFNNNVAFITHSQPKLEFVKNFSLNKTIVGNDRVILKQKDKTK